MTGKLIIQAGNMTGDMFGVAAALLINKDVHVVLLRENSERDKTESLRKFYMATLGGNSERIHVLSDLPNISDSYSQYTRRPTLNKITKEIEIDRIALPFEETVPSIPEPLRDKEKQALVSEATTVVAANWSAKRRVEIRKAWKVESFDEQIKQYLKQKKIPYETTRSYAILWSRFSGKHGGPHAQHDTSFEGMRQLVALARKTGRTVLIVGDHNPTRSSVDKYKWLKTTGEGAVFNLSEFWENPKWTNYCQNERMAQFALFDFLNRQSGKNLKHLGFRSGNLEIYALLGHQVRYLEETGNRESNRMKPWKRLGYELISVSKVPTKTGQYVVTETGKPQGRKKEVKPPWIKDESILKENHIDPLATRGFGLEDLRTIETYFQDQPSEDQLIQNLEAIQEHYKIAEQTNAWPKRQK